MTLTKNFFGGHLLLLALFSANISWSINLSKVEFSYLYKDSPANMRYQIAQKDGTYRLVAYLDLKKITDSDVVKNFTLLSQKKFTSSKEDIVQALTKYTSNSGSTVIYDMSFKLNPEHTYLVVRFTFLNKPYIFDIPIGEATAFPPPDFILKSTDPSQTVIKKSDSLTFDPLGRPRAKYYSYLYKDHFSHSFPPFSQEIPDGNTRFVIESINSAKNGMTLSKENYLYYFQSDTASKKGVAVYSHEEYFPNNKNIDELYGPLVYIATEKEFQKLNNANDKKKGFDDFWLSLIPSKKLAARTIRNYFRRVKRADYLFTNYKTGWKTDMGMIYILYGAPNRVSKTEDGEMWEFDSYAGKIKFSFTKVPNLFTRFHYSLNRQKNYTSVWFSQVEKWRKGDS